MRKVFRFALCFVLCAAFNATQAQTPTASAASNSADGMPISTLIDTVANKSRKKMVVDPRVQAQVILVGQKTTDVSYGDFLSILGTYGFAAVENGGYVHVVPASSVRSMAVPAAASGKQYLDAEYVNKVISIKSMPSAYLVPMLRPLLPQYAHLAALPCKNKMIVLDTYANVKRLEALIEALDVGAPYTPEPCSAPESSSKPER